MFHKLLKRSLLVFFLSFVLSGVALADTVQGRVLSASSSALNLTVYDANNKPYPNALKLKVDNRTKLTGYSMTSLPRSQDMVRVGVSQEKSGVWRADSVSKLKGTQLPPAPAKAPSPGLMDALKSPQGQTVIKRGLTGALVGGVAAGASGGKAGKGALIGAGASVLGGFLMDAVSQPSQSQQPTYTTQVQTEDYSKN